jgi:MFS family permease
MSQFPHHRRVFAAFFFYAVVMGALFPRLADIQLRMGVGEAALGVGLLGTALGTQITLMLGGTLIERVGHRLTLLIGVPMLGAAQVGAALSPSVPVFFGFLVLSGLAVGCVEIVINLEADRGEQLLGRRIMSRAHAFWSFGFFTSGLIGAGLAEIRVAPWLGILLVDICAVALLALVLRDFRDAPSRTEAEPPPPRFVAPTRGILALVAFTLSAMLLEGAIIDWSVIYMRDSFEVSRLVNGFAFALGAGAQGLTRFVADRFVDRHGPVTVARAMVLSSGLGAFLVAASPWPALSLVGFALIGIGVASAFPLAMSAAARRTDRSPRANVAALAQMSFIVFLLAPPMLGFVAQHAGIRWSYAIGLPLVVLSWLFTPSLASRR